MDKYKRFRELIRDVRRCDTEIFRTATELLDEHMCLKVMLKKVLRCDRSKDLKLWDDTAKFLKSLDETDDISDARTGGK